ncbi:MAG: glutamine synthetase family protein, partial [Rhodococcus sp. (in: high G+C Gram-positive bacteria)]|uniref:glutamine synthetase n=1 Tax=Rhodococcus sp. TaxID=1831 RepID=UPI003BB1E4A6
GAGASPSWNVFCIDDHLSFTPSHTVTGDLRLRIERDRVRHLGDGMFWAPAGLFEQDGTPALTCTRWLLQRIVREMAEAGVTAQIGHELEFTLFGSVTEEWSSYGLNAVLEKERFVGDLLEAADVADLAIEQIHAEAGRNQFEISIAPADPVTAADNATLARILVSRVARAHGLRASFSPVPVVGDVGNGAHQHVSFRQGDRPILSGGTGPHGLTPAGGSVIAGIVRALPDFMAVFAGSVLSHLRLQPAMWAGAHRCWGLENREAAVRLCALNSGNPYGAHIEIKPIDPSSNVYLSSTAILGAAHAGLTEALPLPPEVSVNPTGLAEEERVRLGVTTLPTGSTEILQNLEGSALARHLFGPLTLEAFLAVRNYEFAEYGSQHPGEVAGRFRFAWTF